MIRRLLGWGSLGGLSVLVLVVLSSAPVTNWQSLNTLFVAGDWLLPWLPITLLGLALGFSVYFGAPRLSWHTLFFLFLYLYCFHSWLELPFLFDDWNRGAFENSWLALPYLIPIQALLIDRFLRFELFSVEGGMLISIFLGEFLGMAILSEVFSAGWAGVFEELTRMGAGWMPDGMALLPILFLLIFAGLLWGIRDRDFYTRGRPILLLVVVLGTMGFLPGFEWFGPRNQPYHLAVIGSLQGLLLLTWAFNVAWSKAYLDQLTQVKGRMALDEHLARLSGTYAIVMIDIDEFKDFNDTYGHDAGDIVLQRVGDVLERHATGDVYRFGGEEFTIIYPGTHASELEEQLETLRDKIASNRVKVTKKSSRATKKYEKRVTISLGAASPSEDLTNAQKVLNAADEAMYSAKDSGRDCWEVVGS